MNIHVRFGASVAHNLGSAPLQVELPNGAQLRDLMRYLEREHPLWAGRLIMCTPVSAGGALMPFTALTEGQEVWFIMPMA